MLAASQNKNKIMLVAILRGYVNPNYLWAACFIQIHFNPNLLHVAWKIGTELTLIMNCFSGYQ